jgi:ADP-ribosyl-[dinitrogen reductase] hydrolase
MRFLVQFTDDTSMALCLAISLIVCQDFVPYDQLVRYTWWFKQGYMSSTGNCFDIGAATSESLREFQKRQYKFGVSLKIPTTEMSTLPSRQLLDDFDVYCGDEEAAGNGALMRLAPIPLFYYRNVYAAIVFAGRSAEITHADPRAVDACRYYAALIVAALRGTSKKDLLSDDFYAKHRRWFGAEPLHNDIASIARGSYKKAGGYDEGIRGKGFVVDALEAALWAFWSDNDSFEKGALAAVNLGDDTDTTAAIYGQLAGAVYGYEKLPKHWLDLLYGKKLIIKLSKWIVHRGDEWEKRDRVEFQRSCD